MKRTYSVVAFGLILLASAVVGAEDVSGNEPSSTDATAASTSSPLRPGMTFLEVEQVLGAPDWKDFHEQRRKGTHDLYLYQWSVSTPDPERFLFPLYHSTSTDNYGRYTSAKADEILTQARQPMDDARRLRLYREATRLILADVPTLFLFHQTAIAAQHVRAHGLTLNLYGWPQDKLSTVETR